MASQEAETIWGQLGLYNNPFQRATFPEPRPQCLRSPSIRPPRLKVSPPPKSTTLGTKPLTHRTLEDIQHRNHNRWLRNTNQFQGRDVEFIKTLQRPRVAAARTLRQRLSPDLTDKTKWKFYRSEIHSNFIWDSS